jgi:hypothetical protein
MAESEETQTMRFLSIYLANESKFQGPPSPEHVAEMGKLIEKSMKAGTLVDTGGVSNPKRTVRVRRAGGKVSITDGPFTESKELVAGYAILEATSREHAIQLAEEFLGAVGEGMTELHELYSEPPGVPPQRS